jgi:hypothetical protein
MQKATFTKSDHDFFDLLTGSKKAKNDHCHWLALLDMPGLKIIVKKKHFT